MLNERSQTDTKDHVLHLNEMSSIGKYIETENSLGNGEVMGMGFLLKL